MTVYGVSFGGGWDGMNIYYAEGRLSGSDLTITGVRRCDDRLDLFATIVASGAPWVLDFPFALPEDAYRTFPSRNWQGLLDFVDIVESAEFAGYMDRTPLVGFEDRCQHPGPGCRLTDAESGAFSPLKRSRPNRLEITYSGLILLIYLRRYGVRVYPFDEPELTRSRVYEVDPWNTRARVGLGRTAGPWDFLAAFEKWDGRAVEISLLEDLLPPSYDLNAVVACATLANAIRAFDLEGRWDEMPACASPPEWGIRHREGLIVRL
jgi:hypothetical protein